MNGDALEIVRMVSEQIDRRHGEILDYLRNHHSDTRDAIASLEGRLIGSIEPFKSNYYKAHRKIEIAIVGLFFLTVLIIVGLPGEHYLIKLIMKVL